MKRQTVEQWDAGYVRVSTDMQMERDALQNQVQALEAYALSPGGKLRLYKGEGISAKDTDRPDLQRLLGDARSGWVRTVLVTKLDRISRSLADLLDLMRLFEQHGVKFVSLRDNIDTSGPVGRLMLHILGAIAELERGLTAERVAEDMNLRVRRGKWNGGLAPYARRVEDGQLVWRRFGGSSALSVKRASAEAEGPREGAQLDLCHWRGQLSAVPTGLTEHLLCWSMARSCLGGGSPDGRHGKCGRAVFVDTRLSGHNLRHGIAGALEFVRAAIAEGRVPAATVVPALDLGEDHRANDGRHGRRYDGRIGRSAREEVRRQQAIVASSLAG